MARAIWSGTISFGLVNVPVKLYSAVHSKNLQFHQFDPKGNRVKQSLAAIRPLDGVLALSTMRFADEVVPTSEVKNGSSGKGASVSSREIDMASQIIDSLTSKWDPSQYHDTYREQVLGLLKKKAEGKEIVVDEPEEEQGQG